MFFSFLNNTSSIDPDLSTTNDKGWPKNWYFYPPNLNKVKVTCSTNRENILTISSGGTAYYNIDLKNHETSKGLRVEMYIKTKENIQPSMVSIKTHNNDFVDKSIIAAITPDNNGWYKISSDVVSAKFTNMKLSVLIYNMQQCDISIKNIKFYQDQPLPTPRSATLLKAVFDLPFIITAEKLELWIPLPIDYASQTPLSLNLSITPKDTVKGIKYELDKYDNFGVYIRFNDNLESKNIHIHWESIIFTKLTNKEERQQIYTDNSDPLIWLSDTAVVNSKNPELQDILSKIIIGNESKEEEIEKIVKWLHSNLNQDDTKSYEEEVLKGLDSDTALSTKFVSCTGYANLAAALGRASMIPTRVMANIMVGAEQQTHYIVEFHLQDGTWLRIEPQPTPKIDEDSYVILRKIPPEQEGEESFADGRAIKGVPYKSLPEWNMDYEKVSIEYVDNKYFTNQNCYQAAYTQINFRESKTKINKLFDVARKAWQQDIHLLMNGTDADEIFSQRSAAESITTIGDLEEFLLDLDS